MRGWRVCPLPTHSTHPTNIPTPHPPLTQELESCKLLNSMDGSPLQGVYITLRMRLLCEIFRWGQDLRGGCAIYEHGVGGIEPSGRGEDAAQLTPSSNPK